MDKIKKTLSIDDAYDAMVDYLESYYNRTKSDDVGSLLSGMQLLEDKTTADPAAMHDWKESVKKILEQKSKIHSNIIFMKKTDDKNP